jgi:hypothetical protein
MARARIVKLPKALSGLEVKMAPGLYGTNGNRQFSLPTQIDSQKYSEPDTEVRNTLKPVPREMANLEAEKGETAVVNIDGFPAHFNIGGKRHSEGGTPLNLPDNSFIFSDTAKMKIKDPEILKQFGMAMKSGGFTPADIAKKYQINNYRKMLADPETDDLQRKTAEMMIANYNEKLAKLALAQESKKGFPQGIPAIAIPYIDAHNIDTSQYAPTQAQQEDPNANMGVARYGANVIAGWNKMQVGGPIGDQTWAQDATIGSSYNLYLEALASKDPKKMRDIGKKISDRDIEGFGWWPGSRQGKLHDLGYDLMRQATLTERAQAPKELTEEELDINTRNKAAELFTKLYNLKRKATEAKDFDAAYNYDVELENLHKLHPDYKAAGFMRKKQSAKQEINSKDFYSPAQPAIYYTETETNKVNDLYDKYLKPKEVAKAPTTSAKPQEKKVEAKPLPATTPTLNTSPNSVLVKPVKTKKDTTISKEALDALAQTDPDAYDKLMKDFKVKEYQGGGSTATAVRKMEPGKIKPEYSMEEAYGPKGVARQNEFRRHMGLPELPSNATKAQIQAGAGELQKYAIENYPELVSDYMTEKNPKPNKKLEDVLRSKGYKPTNAELKKAMAEGNISPEDIRSAYKDDQWWFRAIKADRKKVSPEEYEKLMKRPGSIKQGENMYYSEDPSKPWEYTTYYTDKPAPKVELKPEVKQEVEPAKQEVKRNPIVKGNPPTYAPWWLQDIIGTAGAFGDLSRVKKYQPWQATPQAFLPQATFYDPTRELAANAEQANIASQFHQAFTGPKTGQMAGVQGQAMKNAADIMGKYNNLNVGVANQLEQERAQIMNAASQNRANLSTQLWDKYNIANQQFDNAKNQAREQLRKHVISAVTNRAKTQALNTLYPNYYTDPSLGGFLNFAPGYDPKPVGKGEDYIDKVWNKAKIMDPNDPAGMFKTIYSKKGDSEDDVNPELKQYLRAQGYQE